MSDPIKKISLKDGRTRYRFVVDIGRDPVTGKRQQKTFTFDLKREASAELSRIRSEMARDIYVRSSTMTVANSPIHDANSDIHRAILHARAILPAVAADCVVATLGSVQWQEADSEVRRFVERVLAMPDDIPD